MAGKILIA